MKELNLTNCGLTRFEGNRFGSTPVKLLLGTKLINVDGNNLQTFSNNLLLTGANADFRKFSVKNFSNNEFTSVTPTYDEKSLLLPPRTVLNFDNNILRNFNVDLKESALLLTARNNSFSDCSLSFDNPLVSEVTFGELNLTSLSILRNNIPELYLQPAP